MKKELIFFAFFCILFYACESNIRNYGALKFTVDSVFTHDYIPAYKIIKLRVVNMTTTNASICYSVYHQATFTEVNSNQASLAVKPGGISYEEVAGIPDNFPEIKSPNEIDSYEHYLGNLLHVSRNSQLDTVKVCRSLAKHQESYIYVIYDFQFTDHQQRSVKVNQDSVIGIVFPYHLYIGNGKIAHVKTRITLQKGQVCALLTY